MQHSCLGVWLYTFGLCMQLLINTLKSILIPSIVVSQSGPCISDAAIHKWKAAFLNI